MPVASYNFLSSKMSLSDNRVLFQTVLNDLMLATHCHSCDDVVPVALVGYHNAHCCRSCWKGWEKAWDYSLDCKFGPDCKVCNDIPYTLANSMYHRLAKTMMNESGCVWPMGDYKRPCMNETLRAKSPIQY
jgi:hypothetical protein